jgi:branched-chain amino acid transport system ATP-binding protein
MLELDSIHTYYGDSHVLKGVSLELNQGEIVGLLGRNGAGKTTTLRSITGLTPPRRGTVTFEGEEITGDDVTTISRKGIKLVLEDRRVFPDLTVDENLRLSQDTTHSNEWTVDRVLNEFPRLEERASQLGSHLSGGEQQMLVIAQALVGNPKAILLDEPMEGLAPQIVDQISDIIHRIHESGMTILLVEQNIGVCLDLMDRGYLLHKGEVQFAGTARDFRESPELLEQYLSVGV